MIIKHKVLINLFVPELERKLELYLPVNRTVSEVIFMINRLLLEITNDLYPKKSIFQLSNRDSGIVYNHDLIIRNTDIRNGSNLVII